MIARTTRTSIRIPMSRSYPRFALGEPSVTSARFAGTLRTTTCDRHGGEMTASGERPGGLAAWAPRAVPGPGIDLTAAQELAIALRTHDAVGRCEKMTGHITVQQG